MNKKHTQLIVAFLIVASLMAFGRILGNGFVNLDDEMYVTKNPHIQSGVTFQTVKWAFTEVVSSNWHPLTMLSHALDWSLFKDHAGGHHLVNLLLHMMSGLLLFFFLNKSTKSIWPSAFVAAFFVLHPLRVESVAWVSERKDVLSVFFGLAALNVYALYAEKQKISSYLLCLLLFVFGLLSKPMLVTLPFVFLLLDFWPFGRWSPASKVLNQIPGGNANLPAKKKAGKQKLSSANISAKNKFSGQNIWYLVLEKTPFFIFSLVFSVITVWAQNKGGAIASLEKISFSERLINAVVAYAAYLGKMIWPANLSVFYPYSSAISGWVALGAISILIAVTFFVVYFVKKAPFLIVGWLWYLGTLVPVIGLVQVGGQAMADRYTYLPSIGFGIMLAWGVGYLQQKGKLRKKLLIPAAAFIFASLIVLTWQQCGYWKNSVTLFKHALQVTENNYLAHANLAVALASESRDEEALFHYQEAIRINPVHVNAHYNLANLLVKQGKINEAVGLYREVLRMNPHYFDAYNNIGVNLVRLRKYEEAIIYYRRALQIKPDNPGLHLNIGVAFADNGDLKKAIEHFRAAVHLNPGYADARRALKLALEIEGREKR